jgi:hypothetical protein
VRLLLLFDLQLLAVPCIVGKDISEFWGLSYHPTNSRSIKHINRPPVADRVAVLGVFL